MGARGALFVFGVIVRLSPDSARTKNTTPKMIVVQKIGRAACNLFIRVTSFIRARVPYLCIEPPLTHCDSTPAILRRRFQEKQAKSSLQRHGLCHFSGKKVT